MGYKQNIYFNEGMNADIDDRVLKTYRDSLNCRIGTSEENNVFCVENFKGNTLINYSLPSGTNRVIGQCDDGIGESIFYFLYNSNSEHQILSYNISSATITKILHQQPIQEWQVDLNFSPTHFITSCYYIQGLLYWNDDINPPCKINVDKAIRFTNSLGYDPLGYFVINRQTIDRIKWPPKFSPTCSYQNDSTYQFNNLRGSTFQFAYSYIYDDNEISTFSPTSKLPVPQNEELQTGNYVNQTSLNNCIDIIINTGSSTIKAINIYGRSNATDDTPITVSANYSNWYLIDRIEKYDNENNILVASNSDYYYKFYNNKIKNIVDQDDAARLFDYVPQLCGASELVEKNRILDGDITEGYDNVHIDVLLSTFKSPVLYDITSYPIDVTNTFIYNALYLSGKGLFYDIPIFSYSYFTITLPTTGVEVGDIINLSFTYFERILDTNTTVTNYYNQQITVDQSDVSGYPVALRDKIGLILSQKFPIVLMTSGLHDYEIYVMQTWIADGANAPNFILNTGSYYGIASIIASGGHAYGQVKHKTFKSGDYHEFGILYYDRANRSGATNVSSDSIIYVPSTTEYNASMPSNIYTNYGYRNIINWEINHPPPDWATHYQWVYSRNNSTNYYLQYHLMHDTGASFGLTDSLNSIYLDSATNCIRIKLMKALEYYSEISPKSTLSYVWQKGDRLRFIMKPYATGTYWYYYQDHDSSATLTYLDKIDFEITGYDTTTRELILDYFDINQFLYDPVTATGGVHLMGQYSVIEVYRPAKEFGEKLFYEMGECFEIGNPGTATRYHKGLFQDQIQGTQPARGQFVNTGNAYLKLRFTSFAGYAPNQNSTFVAFPCESDSVSDFYVSDSCDIGRVNIVDRNMKRLRLESNLRFSGKLIQDTQINDLSKFEYLNAEQLSDKFGPIERLIEVGNVVKCLQHTKNTSIYVGLVSTGEADGSNNLYVKNTVLGTIRVPVEKWGTKYPECVVRESRAMYFYDSISGDVIRDSANGMFAISGYGMVKPFRDWKEYLRTGVNSYVIGAYDKSKEEYLLTLRTFINNGEFEQAQEYAQTYGFVESENKWSGRKSFIPEYYGFSNNALLAFRDGQLWLQNSNPLYSNFFGVQYPQEITFVANAEPAAIKRFLSMAYDSNKKWSAITIKIPSCDQYPSGMLSRLKENKFVVKEGYYYSEFMCDMNDPSALNVMEGLINGRELRGKTIEITLHNEHTQRVVLFSAYVNMNISMNSGT